MAMYFEGYMLCQTKWDKFQREYLLGHVVVTEGLEIDDLFS